jgi:phosphoglycerate dehydrogenase-like enzyme
MDRVFGVQHAETLTELLVQSDCITLHCQLNAETRNILDNVMNEGNKFP